MAIKQSSQSKIAHALGSDISAWQVFGVYEYAWACRNCACGHNIATSIVLIRKGDHGPAFGEEIEIGTECIKYVRTLSPDLYTWMMTAKAEMDRIKRIKRAERVAALHVDPEYQALRTKLADFITVARLVSNLPSHTTYGVPFYIARCAKAGIEISVESSHLFANVGHQALYIAKHLDSFDIIEDVRSEMACVEKLLPLLRAATEPCRSLLTVEFSAKTKYMPNFEGIRLLYQE